MRCDLLAAAALLALGLMAEATGADESPPRSYAGLSPIAAEHFAAGLAQFRTRETPASGLGPVFNAESCADCHAAPVTGGSSATFVTRFARDGVRGFDPLTEHGGPILQARGVVTEGCGVPGETVPREATIVARRNTPPLFGLGLIEAIPDHRILRLADPEDRNGDGIRGRPNTVRGRVGRFGWKAQVATLREFAAAAYLNEIGITSPDFPAELAPQGGRVVCDEVRDPEDDGSRIDAVTRFMLLLAPLPRAERPAASPAGRRLFRRLGCEVCHTTRLRTGRTHPARTLRGRRVRMFSDLLLHDMGPELADGIPQGFATASEFRTPPLWGVRESAPYLHDGRAVTLEEAVVLHGGEAARARDRFLALPAASRAHLIAFLTSL